MEARGIGSADLNQDMFRLVPVDLSGNEMDSLPFLDWRLLSHVSDVVQCLIWGEKGTPCPTRS